MRIEKRLPIPDPCERCREESVAGDGAADARLRRIAAEANVTVDEVRAVEERLRAIPMETFLTELGFTPDEIVHDPVDQVWIVPDRQYRGPKTGLLIIRSDKSFITVEIDRERMS